MSGRQNMEFQEDLEPKEEVEDNAEDEPAFDQEIKPELDARDVHIRALEADVHQLKETGRQSAIEIGRLNEQLAAARAAPQAPTDRRSMATNQLNQMNQRLKETQQELSEAQKNLNETKTELNQVQHDLIQSMIDMETAQNEAEAAQKNVKALEATVEQLRSSLQSAKSVDEITMNRLRGILEDRNKQIDSINEQLQAAKKYNFEMEKAHKKAIDEFLALDEKRKQDIAGNIAAQDYIFAQLVKEQEQNKELKECNQKQELELKTVKEKLEKLTSKTEDLEERLEAEGEEKNKEILDLKKKLEATEKKWKKKLENVEEANKLECDNLNKTINRLETERITTEKKWEKRLKNVEEANKLESDNLHKTIKNLETERTSTFQFLSNINSQTSAYLQRKRDEATTENEAPQNEEPTRKKRKCTQRSSGRS